MKRQALLTTIAFAAFLVAFVGTSSMASASNQAKLDRSFGPHGIVKTPTNADIADYIDDDFAGGIGDMALDAKGRIVVGGSGGARFLVARYLPNGKLDKTFGNHGEVRVRVGEVYGGPKVIHSKVTAIAIQPNRKILLVGAHSTNGNEDGPPNNTDVAIRLNSDGSVDKHFGDQGLGTSNGFGPPVSTTLLKGGSFLVSGRMETTISWAPNTAGYVGMYKGDGHSSKHLDGASSVVFFPEKPKHAGIVKTKVLASGKFLAGGYFENKLFLARLTPKGKPDKSFGKGGKVVRSLVGNCSCAVTTSMKYDNQGRILLAGRAFPGHKVQNRTFIARFYKNGRIDRSFGKHGVVMRKVDPYVSVGDVTVQEDGRILLIASKDDDRKSKLILFRYLPNGKLDKSFFSNGHLTQKIGSTTNGAKLVIDHHGRILIGGGFARGGKGHFLIERILPGH